MSVGPEGKRFGLTLQRVAEQRRKKLNRDTALEAEVDTPQASPHINIRTGVSPDEARIRYSEEIESKVGFSAREHHIKNRSKANNNKSSA